MTGLAGRSAGLSSQQGFVLVAVLWLVAALAALAMIFSAYLSSSARALSLNDAALQTEALVSASAELTAYRLQLGGEKARPMQGAFRMRLNGADLSVSFVAETSRVDLNRASKELLEGLLSALGAAAEDAREGAERIVAWRSRATAQTAANEEALYRAAGRAYSPRQAPFAHVNELGLVLGLAPALVQRALPFVTVFSGAEGIDATVAAPEVIAALPGMTPLILKQFLSERVQIGSDRNAIAAALGPARASATAEKSRAYRILTRIRFPNGRHAASEVVIRLGGDTELYQVLSWQRDVSAQAYRKL